MHLESIVIEHVRNLRGVTLTPPAKFNVFVGDNGQGKTNLLEAIYVVSALRSFRTSRLAEVMELGAANARIAARVTYGGLSRQYQVALSEKGRSASIDGKAVRPVNRYFGEFNVVVFTPDDLSVPRAAPGDRRRFLDRAVFNQRAGYMSLMADYEKIVRSRNAVLKDMASGRARNGAAMLDVFDTQLATTGAAVIAERREYLARLTPKFVAAFTAIARSGLKVDLRYVAAADSQEALHAAIAAARGKDLARQTSSVGPHRDDVQFLLEGNLAGEFASQGQLRAMVLAWKIAEIDLVCERRGEPPILLLDDVSSELDSARNAHLFEYLATTGGQCFITTTDARHVLLTQQRADFTVRAGELIS